MLHSAAGARIDAAQHPRNAPIHQLEARLELGFHADAGRTRLRVGAQDPPWRVIRAFPHPDGSSLVHLHNVSGGILAGDRLSLRIDVQPGASAQLTSTGATRLYRHRDGSAESRQTTVSQVGEGAVLEYLPDMLIPFRHSRHQQETSVILDEGATYIGWEIVAPGRQAMGEEFGFERLRIKTDIRTQRRPLLLEDFTLEPRVRPLSSVAELGAYTHTISFYAFQVGRSNAELMELESILAEIAREESSTGCTIWGASALASDGVCVRGLSATSRRLPATLVRFWDAARQFLIGRPAIPPRKLK